LARDLRDLHFLNPYYTGAMVRRFGLVMLTVICAAVVSSAQSARRAPPRAAPQSALTKETPEMKCPTPLGMGVNTGRAFCDVMTGTSPAEGIIITLPPHRGPVTLTFDLHNRHTYSEEQMKANRAYARYTALIGALAMDNTLISRAAIQSEFRKASDLVDRIAGGAGTTGLKAVAPTGTESVAIMIPENENQVSILGEKLIIDRPPPDGTATYASPGRPVAVISNVQIEYRPGLPPKPARGR
jgi:hypothetical protein